MSTIGMSIADMPREIFRSGRRARENREGKSPNPDESQPTTSSTNDNNSIAQSSTNLSIISTQAAMETPSLMSEPSLVTETDTLDSTKPPATDSISQTSSHNQTTNSGLLSPVRPPASAEGTRPSSPRREATPVGVSLEAAAGAGRNVGQIVSTGVKSPMNFCLGLAKGFRNVPRLYNDDTVRPVEKVTDFSSGLKVAGKEFGYGLFDGISGLVMQPLRGAEKEGASGLVKGFGKGIGGLITKPAAGKHYIYLDAIKLRSPQD
jgi:hypothetical protein